MQQQLALDSVGELAQHSSVEYKNSLETAMTSKKRSERKIDRFYSDLRAWKAILRVFTGGGGERKANPVDGG